MKPVRVITIKEWMPGDYTVECDGRARDLHSRGELRQYLNGELGDLPLTPDEERLVEELEMQVDDLKEELNEARSDRYV